MKEMPQEPGVVDKIEKKIVEEEVWHTEGGLAPRSVMESLEEGILEKGFEIYPEFREEYIRHIKDEYTHRRFLAAQTALALLYVHTRVEEWPVSLLEVCKGPFVDQVKRLYEARLTSEKPLYDPLGYISFLGQDVLDDLIKIEWVEYQDTPGGDEHTPSGSYILTEKGKQVVESRINWNLEDAKDLWKEFRETGSNSDNDELHPHTSPE